VLVWNPAQGSCDATFAAAPESQPTQPEHLQIATDLPHPGYLVLRLRSYPAWQVRLNGQPAPAHAPREDGLMAIPFPQGPVNLTVDWHTTDDVLAGRWISGISLLLVTLLCLLERRLSHTRLS